MGYMGVFKKIRVPQNGWFILENPIKMDALGVPIFGNIHIGVITLMILTFDPNLLGHP